MARGVSVDTVQTELDFLFKHCKTQGAMARAVGVDQSIISLIKNGRKKRVLEGTAQGIRDAYKELNSLGPTETPSADEKTKRLEVGESYKFTRMVGGRRTMRKEVATLIVIAEYKRFYAVMINGTKDTVLKNDLQTDMYDLQPC